MRIVDKALKRLRDKLMKRYPIPIYEKPLRIDAVKRDIVKYGSIMEIPYEYADDPKCLYAMEKEQIDKIAQGIYNDGNYKMDVEDNMLHGVKLYKFMVEVVKPYKHE